MNTMNNNLWGRVAKRLEDFGSYSKLFRYGQQDSLKWISKRIPENGIIIADEVGLGKTRLALLTMIAVLEEGGTAIVVVPPGLLHQWSQEAQEVMFDIEKIYGQKSYTWKPVILRTYKDIFTVIGEKDYYPLANVKEGRWILISQTFDYYQIHPHDRCRRFELPALVRAHWAINDKAHGKDKWIQYRRQRGIEGVQMDPWLHMEDKAAEYLSKSSKNSYAPEYQEIWDDENIRPNQNGKEEVNSACHEFFKINQPGRKLLMHLTGKLIGSADLLVMDEAHKSREDGEIPQKRLGRLLEEVLEISEQCRHISMTATPIEIDPNQWPSLLRRTGISEKHEKWTDIVNCIQAFSTSLSQASSRPDQIEVLNHLLDSAKRFQEVLSPFITRRRRLFQEEMKQLLPINPQGAHPHRDLKTHVIEIQALPEPWRKMVLSLEGQGLASKGVSSIGMAERMADIRYSSGLPCKYEFEESNPQPLPDRKALRVRAWAKLQQKLTDFLSRDGESWLWNHPRVVEAANRIEELCNFDGLNPREKLLVFGRFSEPMRALRDILNLRHTLRILDYDKVSLVPDVDDGDMRLYLLYQRQYEQRCFYGALAGNMLTKEALLQRVKIAKDRYNRYRDVLRERFHVEREDWITKQPGDYAIHCLKSESSKDFDAIFEMLRADIFDYILYHSLDLKTISDEEIQRIAHETWVSHLRCILHDSDENEGSDASERDSTDKTTEYNGESKELARLDDRADRISPERFKEYLNREPRSHFCRILDGSVHPSTRHSVQASFNRNEVGPYVLVAQSMVGREGLNLHKACRRLFLFHPEWNPGVMEQQIGRVDRIESLWTSLAEDWKKSPQNHYPKIEIESLVFRGTYDEYQANVLQRRRASLNAQLFGALLDEESLEKVPEKYRDKLGEGAPNWEPGR